MIRTQWLREILAFVEQTTLAVLMQGSPGHSRKEHPAKQGLPRSMAARCDAVSGR